MKERPILFQGAMVRALLAGTKSQTRRAIKPQPVYAGGAWKCADGSTHQASRPSKTLLASCPYGQHGDRLYVREAFSGPHCMGAAPPSKWGRSSRLWYWADGNPTHGDWTKPKPSIHMPRAASRITLEITEVRVQRLQEISEEDAKAEGCERLQDDEPGYVERYDPDWKLCPQCGGTRLYTAYGANLGALPDTDCTKCDTYAKRYRWLWESINGDKPDAKWDANPWVWAVSFKRVQP